MSILSWKQDYAENGGTIIAAGGGTATGRFRRIYALGGTAVITTATTPGFTGALNGVTLTSPESFEGLVTAVTTDAASTGVLVCVNAVDN